MYLSRLLLGTMLIGAFSSPVWAETRLTLEMTIKAAQQNDPWLVGSRHNQEAAEAMSVAAGSLPDPRISIGLANIAADSFSFTQEPMTQLKVGVSQMLPRGDTLQIKQKQLSLMASQHPLQRQDRRAKVAVEASKLWLDAFKAQQSITLIEQNRALFEQLADIAQASYSTAIGKTRQQDIVRAQLELTRLEDRLTMLKQQQEMARQRLSQWLIDTPEMLSLPLAKQLPNILLASKPNEQFANHPAMKALEQNIKASGSGIALAQQHLKPQWGLNASYGYRNNSDRKSDLFSIGVSIDIPLFNHQAHHKMVQSAMSRTEAVKTQKWQLMRQLSASLNTTKAQLQRLNERQELYRATLLPQIHEQTEASLTAYTNDEGDFSDVVRARISELNSQIDALGIDVDRQKTIIQLNYFYITSGDLNVAKAAPHTGEK